MIGGKTVMAGCKQAGLQAIPARKARAVAAITSRLAHLAAFKVKAHMPTSCVYVYTAVQFVSQPEVARCCGNRSPRWNATNFSCSVVMMSKRLFPTMPVSVCPADGHLLPSAIIPRAARRQCHARPWCHRRKNGPHQGQTRRTGGVKRNPPWGVFLL